VRHEREALQEENVHLQSECEQLSREVADTQCRAADSGNAETDASRDWRIRCDDRLKQVSTGAVGVVAEGFVLPHDVERLQERIVQLEHSNRILSSMHQRTGQSPDASVAVSDQEICENDFIDEKLRLEASQTRSVSSPSFVCDSATERASLSCSREDADVSPVPSPGFGESHSPAYERLKAEFLAYKQKAQKDCAKLKARLVSVVREYNDLKSSYAGVKSPSPSPILWSSVNPVADVLVLQSKVSEQVGSSDRKHTTSDRHCVEKEVQTDFCDVGKNVYTAEALTHSQTVEKIVETHSSAPEQDNQMSPDGGEMDTVTYVGDRYNALEMEPSALQSHYSALMEQNVSLTGLVSHLQEEVGKQEMSNVAETQAASATSDAELIAENRRLWRQQEIDRSEYQEKLERLEERCKWENAKLKQILDVIKAGSDHDSNGDRSSCRHCAELAEKCRLLETSAELSSLNAERRLHEVEEYRSVAAHLQSRLDQLSEDDKSMVSEMHDSFDNSLFSYVVGNRFVTNVADSIDVVCGALIDGKSSSVMHDALPVYVVGRDSARQFSYFSPNSDVDLEVAETFEPKHEGPVGNIADSNFELQKPVEDDNLRSGVSFRDSDIKLSHSFQYSVEFSDAVLLQAQHEMSALHESCRDRTETFLDLSGQQHLVTESPSIIDQESLRQSRRTETANIKGKPQTTTLSSEKHMMKSLPVTSTEATTIQSESCNGKTGNSWHFDPLVQMANGSGLEKKLCSLSGPDTVKLLIRDFDGGSDSATSQTQEEEAMKAIGSSSVGIEKGAEAYADTENSFKSTSPFGVTNPAVMMENVTRLVSQNEEILRHNRAWTDKLKHEYEIAACELQTMKNKYEAVVCEKEKVQACLLLAQQYSKTAGFNERNQAVAGKMATISNDTTVRSALGPTNAETGIEYVSQSSSEVADESLSIKVRSVCDNLALTALDMSAQTSSSVHEKLKLLQLEKKELCMNLETEKQKSGVLEQQHSEIAVSVEQLEGESEGQLSSARLQLEKVCEEKEKLCRQVDELSAQLETARVIQTETGKVKEHESLIHGSVVDADAVVSIVCEDVTDNHAGSQQLALRILELEAGLECATVETLALQEKVEHCQAEHKFLMQNVEHLKRQLDGANKLHEDSVNELQELITAKSVLENTSSALISELETLKCHCCSLQGDVTMLSGVAESLQSELKSTKDAKELLSQHRDELLAQAKSVQRQIACLEQQNADFQSRNEKNECFLVEIAGFRKDHELLLREKEELLTANSVAESGKCLLEEQCSKLAEKLHQLEFTESEMRSQHIAEQQNLYMALEHKQTEYNVLLEELEAAKLAAELSALKLHDSLKCSEQYSQQLATAESIIRDFEEKLSEKQNELQSARDLHMAALSTVDEITSRSALLQNENETISVKLCELGTEKDLLLAESNAKVEALETELQNKTVNISLLSEKVEMMASENKQLLNELQNVNTALCETREQLQVEKTNHKKQMYAVKEQREEERASVKVICDNHLAELEEISLRCSDSESRLLAVQTESCDLKLELNDAREEIEKQQDLVDSLSSKYWQYKDDAEAQLAEVKSIRDCLADNLTECQQEKKEADEKLEQLADEFECCKREMAALIAEMDDFKQSNDDLKSRVAKLQKNEEDLAGKLQELRTEHAESCALHRAEMEEQKQMALKAAEEKDELRGIYEKSCQLIDETIAKYTEVETQLSHLRQTNDLLKNDLDKSNQRCEEALTENAQVICENRQLVDSLTCKTAENGLLAVESNTAEAKVASLSSELESLHEQLMGLVSREEALQTEAKELNSQLLLKEEHNQQLSQKLDADKQRESEFSSLLESYNIVVTEKNALEAENQLLSNQVEGLHTEQFDLQTQLKMSHSSNSAFEEKLQQLLQECDTHCIKISELEEFIAREHCCNKKITDSLENYKTLINETSLAVSSLSEKFQSDNPDETNAGALDTSHDEYTNDDLNQYSHILPNLYLISKCYNEMTEKQHQQEEKLSAIVAAYEFLKAQASVDVGVDVNLQDEVARLFQAKTDLENEVMHLRAENMEAKNVADRRDVEMEEKQVAWEQKLADLHHLLDIASQSKEALETELLCERNEFEKNLAAARSNSLLRAGRTEKEQRKIVEQLSDAESHLAGLRDRLRASQDERDLLQLRLAYVTRECSVKERHVDDLRAQVAAQHAHIEEAMKEHRETVQLLVELRLEQQLGQQEQRGEFSRLEEEILRLESHVESCSSRVGTPQSMSLVSAPVLHRPSSVQSLQVDSACQTAEETAIESDHDQTFKLAADKLEYKALETKHFQLVQELSELKQQLVDVRDANKYLIDENARLKQHLQSKPVPPDPSLPGCASLCNIPEHKSSLDFLQAPFRVQSCEQFSSVASTTSMISLDQRAVGLNIPVEMLCLQAKLVRLQKDYQQLVDENTELRTSLLVKQDDLVKQMEIVREKQKKRSFRFGLSSTSSENVAAMTEVSGQQIQLLQKERDELRSRLDAARVKEDEAAELRDKVEQLEYALAKERQKFHDLYQEKESIEIQLLREQLTVEKHVREYQQLQGLMSKRDRLEQQLHKTSSTTSTNSTSSAGTRQLLQDKKSQLVVEIRRKIMYRDVALQVGDSSLRPVRCSQVMSVQPVVKRPSPMTAEKSLRLDCGCVTELGTMRMRTGCRYHQAVERLRRELKAQDMAARKSKPGKHANGR